MSTEWYVALEGESSHPCSGAMLKQLAEEGRITPFTLVRKGQDGNWVVAQDVRGLIRQAPPSAEVAAPPVRAAAATEKRISLSSDAPSHSPPNISDSSSGAASETFVERCLQADDKRPVDSVKLSCCRDCGKLVSGRASQCVHCGCPIQAGQKHTKTILYTEGYYRGVELALRIACGILGIILLIVEWVLAKSHSPEAPTVAFTIHTVLFDASRLRYCGLFDWYDEGSRSSWIVAWLVVWSPRTTRRFHS